MTDDESTALDALHAAVQTFSNSLADDSVDSGIVGHAVVVWEETSFGDDGDLRRAVMYAATGDAASPAGSMGLLALGTAQLQADAVGCSCDGD